MGGEYDFIFEVFFYEVICPVFYLAIDVLYNLCCFDFGDSNYILAFFGVYFMA